MILKLFLNIQMIWMIFKKILKNTIPKKPRKVLMVFDDMITDLLSNKQLNSVVTELYIRSRKLNIPLVFVIQHDFSY